MWDKKRIELNWTSTELKSSCSLDWPRCGEGCLILFLPAVISNSDAVHRAVNQCQYQVQIWKWPAFLIRNCTRPCMCPVLLFQQNMCVIVHAAQKWFEVGNFILYYVCMGMGMHIYICKYKSIYSMVQAVFSLSLFCVVLQCIVSVY